MKRKLVFFLSMTAILSFTAMFSFVNASQVTTVTVDALTWRALTFNLDSGQEFTGSLSISGGSGNDLDFWVTNPQGTTILNQGRVSQGTTFEFTAQSSGAYTLHLDNSFSLFSSKVVSLTYEVGLPTLGGIDLGLLLTIIGVVVILLMVIVVLTVALQRRTASKTNQPPHIGSQT